MIKGFDQSVNVWRTNTKKNANKKQTALVASLGVPLNPDERCLTRLPGPTEAPAPGGPGGGRAVIADGCRLKDPFSTFPVEPEKKAIERTPLPGGQGYLVLGGLEVSIETH